MKRTVVTRVEENDTGDTHLVSVTIPINYHEGDGFPVSRRSRIRIPFSPRVGKARVLTRGIVLSHLDKPTAK